MSEEKIKSEQKLLPQRLMSFRGSRDLSLGSLNAGKPRVGFPNNRGDTNRKQFVPNVNVQRRKNQEVRVKEEFTKDNERKNARGPRGRGQGRGRHTTNLVQASRSVFSEGIAVSAITSSRRSGPRYDGGDSKDGILEVPKLNLKQNCKIDKDEEDRKLNELLRDNFVNNSDLEPDPKFPPIALPLISNRKKKEKDVKLKIEPKVKKEKVEIVGGVKIKQEIIENDDENNFGIAGIPECHIKQEPLDSELDVDEDDDDEKLFQSLNTTKKKLLLIQFPDRLPALSVDSSAETERSNSNVKCKTNKPVNLQESSETKKYCVLGDLAPGHVGYLQVRRSGKVQLVMGKCVLNVSHGTPIGFQQDIVAVQLQAGEQLTGESVELGPITTRLVCTPDFKSLLE